MKKFLTFILVVITITGFSQKGPKNPFHTSHEIGLMFGTSNYVGDLAWKGTVPILKETNPAAFRPAGGVFYRATFTQFTSARVSCSIGTITGDDSQTNGDPARLNRNLHFRSIIVECAAMFEWNMIPYQVGDMKRVCTPYIGIGAAAFYFNPQARYQGDWVALQPLGTEGQGIIEGKEKYSRFQFAVPASIGVKANVTKKISLDLSFQYRYTFTDYLDDVSSPEYVSSQVFYEHYSEADATMVDALAYRAIDPGQSPRNDDRRGEIKFRDHYYFVMLGVSYALGSKSKTIKCYEF